jgi:enamine deaminase RidA (YjgF/YER057c/UK114 family)
MSGVILSINKETMSLGMTWEKEYGYAQAVKVRDTIYVSGQVAHDDNGKIIGKGEIPLIDKAMMLAHSIDLQSFIMIKNKKRS